MRDGRPERRNAIAFQALAISLAWLSASFVRLQVSGIYTVKADFRSELGRSIEFLTSEDP